MILFRLYNKIYSKQPQFRNTIDSKNIYVISQIEKTLCLRSWSDYKLKQFAYIFV